MIAVTEVNREINTKLIVLVVSFTGGSSNLALL
jgi:hypothetical protein